MTTTRASKPLVNSMRRYSDRFSATIAALVLATPAAGLAEAPADYAVKARSYRTEVEAEVPRYAGEASESWGFEGMDVSWLDIGLDNKSRYERYRDNFLRPAGQGDEDYLLTRTRLFLRVRDILDPLRLTVELQDARRAGGEFPRTSGEVDELDVLQAYGELAFDDLLGKRADVRFRGGRMAFEVLDRRLLARNEFRNVNQSYQGARLLIGEDKGPWALDLFAVQPVERREDEANVATEGQWLYAGILEWRKWSRWVTLQPHYFQLNQAARDGRASRLFHTLGLRGYGLVPGTHWDYDLNLNYQFGRDGRLDHSAYAWVAEVGYQFEGGWKPRVSTLYAEGSGDQDPKDQQSERFNALFGFNQPWSRHGYFSWDNVRTPKLRVEFSPNKRLRFDTALHGWWLQSDQDGWQRAGLRDRSGQSGTYLGHEFDVRARYRMTPQAEAELSYAWFQPGSFSREQGRLDASRFIYLQLSLTPLRKD